MNYILIILLFMIAILVIFVGTILMRTIMFTSKQVTVSSKVSYSIDSDHVAQRLRGAIEI